MEAVKGRTSLILPSLIFGVKLIIPLLSAGRQRERRKKLDMKQAGRHIDVSYLSEGVLKGEWSRLKEQEESRRLSV